MQIVQGKFFPVTNGIHCREDIDDTEIGGLAVFLGFPGEGPDIAVDEPAAGGTAYPISRNEPVMEEREDQS